RASPSESGRGTTAEVATTCQVTIAPGSQTDPNSVTTGIAVVVCPPGVRTTSASPAASAGSVAAAGTPGAPGTGRAACTSWASAARAVSSSARPCPSPVVCGSSCPWIATSAGGSRVASRRSAPSHSADTTLRGSSMLIGRTYPGGPRRRRLAPDSLYTRGTPCRAGFLGGGVPLGSEAMGDVLQFDDVTVRRGNKTILDSVSWSVEEGDRWVVLGPNGAGKTTMVQLASARMHPTSGTVQILGERLGSVDVFELRPLVGLASAALADRIPGGETVLDVVLTASYGVTGRWREVYEDLDTGRARDLLAAFDVAGLEGRYFGSLSEGERKRVQIARALMTDPEILILDEPGAGLDLGGREELVGALGELAGDLASPVLVLITHHVEEIPAGFTDAMLLREGRVVSAAPIEQALTAQNLSATFGLELDVQRYGHRWSARAASEITAEARHAHDSGISSRPF